MTDNVSGRERHPLCQITLNHSPIALLILLLVILTPAFIFLGEK